MDYHVVRKRSPLLVVWRDSVSLRVLTSLNWDQSSLFNFIFIHKVKSRLRKRGFSNGQEAMCEVSVQRDSSRGRRFRKGWWICIVACVEENSSSNLRQISWNQRVWSIRPAYIRAFAQERADSVRMHSIDFDQLSGKLENKMEKNPLLTV